MYKHTVLSKEEETIVFFLFSFVFCELVIFYIVFIYKTNIKMISVILTKGTFQLRTPAGDYTVQQSSEFCI